MAITALSCRKVDYHGQAILSADHTLAVRKNILRILRILRLNLGVGCAGCAGCFSVNLCVRGMNP